MGSYELRDGTSDRRSLSSLNPPTQLPYESFSFSHLLSDLVDIRPAGLVDLGPLQVKAKGGETRNRERLHQLLVVVLHQLPVFRTG